MPPDARAAVVERIDSVRRRRVALDAVESSGVALIMAAALWWVLKGAVDPWIATASSVLAAAIAGGVLFVRRRSIHSAAAAAQRLEACRPASKNVIVTAEELTRHPQRATEGITERVMFDAARALDGVSATDVDRAQRPVLTLLAGVVLLALAIVAPTVRDTASTVADLGRAASEALRGSPPFRLTVQIVPPEYAGLESRAVTDPDRLEVLAGTRLRFSVSGDRPARLRFGPAAVGAFSTPGATIEVIAEQNGYFVLEPQDGDAPPALVALAVTPDRSPTVAVEQPAKDLLLPDARRTVPVHVRASDDLGLSALELRYTKVSGSGEQFEFIEGSLPLTVSRDSTRDWRGTAQFSLAALALEPGDSLVYRAVARDRRQGDAAAGSSETFYIEIAGPGQVPLEGIEMPPNEERYALSQQMMVVKIERLKARAPSMSREALREESSLLAAEQRSVRANFVFLLGGHVEDEEVEAEQSHEIAEGRLQNTARRDITVAIGHMTRAEQGLAAFDAGRALPPARAAVEALQRAFGRSRYLLRTLASRTPLDPARRLTGNLSAAAGWRRAPGGSDPRSGDQVRALLDDLLAAYEGLNEDAPAQRRFTQLAERTLAIDPASAAWQDAARRVRSAAGERAPRDARKILEGVIRDVAVLANDGLVPSAELALPRSALERAWKASGSR